MVGTYTSLRRWGQCAETDPSAPWALSRWCVNARVHSEANRRLQTSQATCDGKLNSPRKHAQLGGSKDLHAVLHLVYLSCIPRSLSIKVSCLNRKGAKVEHGVLPSASIDASTAPGIRRLPKPHRSQSVPPKLPSPYLTPIRRSTGQPPSVWFASSSLPLCCQPGRRGLVTSSRLRVSFPFPLRRSILSPCSVSWSAHVVCCGPTRRTEARGPSKFLLRSR